MAKIKNKKLYQKTWFNMSVLFTVAIIVGGFFYYKFVVPFEDVGFVLGGEVTIGQKIIVEEKDNGKEVYNRSENIKIRFLKDWEISKGTSEILKIRGSKVGDKQPEYPSELIDGGIIKVLKYNLDGLSIESWLKENAIIVSGKGIDDRGNDFYIRYDKVFFEEDNSFNLIEIEESQILNYFYSSDSDIYILECTAVGQMYKSVIGDCKQIFSTFIF